jgi:TetR/AcrR family transcriptional regulator, regulator of cefoperazone and chloramphenicol sensitivity
MESTPMPVSRPGRRPDGRVTAEAVLQAAGAVFAEKGPDRATSKEICARAGTSAAAVNYYFGGIGPLYDAVLLRAHERLLDSEGLAALATAEIAPAEKIERLITLHLEALLGLGLHAWELRVISRELIAPSPALARFHEEQAAPRLLLIRRIVAEAMELPATHSITGYAAFCSLAPCAMLLTGPPGLVRDITGSDRFEPAELPALTERLAGFAMGGIRALAEMTRAEIARKRDDGRAVRPPVVRRTNR